MKNDLIAILNLLTSRDKFKLVIVTIAQVLISLLDLIGIFAIGLLGIISVNELQSTKVNPKIDELLEIYPPYGSILGGVILPILLNFSDG